MRRLEVRHGSYCRIALRVLLLLRAFVDSKHVLAERDDVVFHLVLTKKTLHQGKILPRKLADLPAGRDVPHTHRIVGAGADDLCAVVAELYRENLARVPCQRAHL